MFRFGAWLPVAFLFIAALCSAVCVSQAQDAGSVEARIIWASFFIAQTWLVYKSRPMHWQIMLKNTPFAAWLICRFYKFDPASTNTLALLSLELIIGPILRKLSRPPSFHCHQTTKNPF
jgi:hypothetical protein